MSTKCKQKSYDNELKAQAVKLLKLETITNPSDSC